MIVADIFIRLMIFYRTDFCLAQNKMVHAWSYMYAKRYFSSDPLNAVSWCSIDIIVYYFGTLLNFYLFFIERLLNKDKGYSICHTIRDKTGDWQVIVDGR